MTSTHQVNQLLYGDDTYTIAPSPTALQELLDIYVLTLLFQIVLFLMRKCMCFKPNSLNGLFIPTLCLNDVPLTFPTSNKYLGVIIHDKHQDDDDDIMRCVQSLYSRGKMLINRFKTCYSSIKVKLFRLQCL